MATKKRKPKKKPNVFKASYEVASGNLNVVGKSYRFSKSNRNSIERQDLYLNTFSKELRRFGIIAGSISVALAIIAIVLNVI